MSRTVYARDVQIAELQKSIKLRELFEEVHGWTFRKTLPGLYTLWSELDRSEPVVENVTFEVLQLEYDLINGDLTQEEYDEIVQTLK